MRQSERTHLSVALQCVVNVADSTHDPITALLGRSIVVDTPLSRIGSRYAILDRPHIERWGRGAFLVTLWSEPLKVDTDGAMD